MRKGVDKNDLVAIRAQIERELDRSIVKARADDRDFLLSRGFTIREAGELMQKKDKLWSEWREETIAELFAKTLRIAAAPDAPSHSVN
jgi:hypothetical protein